MRNDAYQSRNGLRTLGPSGIALFRALEQRFLGWAGAVGAIEKHYPVLMSVADLARFDYFKNFPQIIVCGCGIHHDRLDAYAGSDGKVASIDTSDLTPSDHVLAPAACYNIFLDYQDTRLSGDVKVTTVAQCHRNETHYQGLARLRGFHMREIVCIGSAEGVKSHVSGLKQTVTAFLSSLGLPFEVELATDPFFDKMSERALAARLFPTKEEVKYAGEVAIASFNFHRNFFGERCGIVHADGPAFSGCVAFGIERWIHALLEHYGSASAAREALDSVYPRAA